MILIILVVVCVSMALLRIRENDQKKFWKWLALANVCTAINCFFMAQYGLCIIISLVSLAMFYLPDYIGKSFR